MSETETEEGAPAGRGKFVQFENKINYGSVLVFLGMLGTGALGLYEVGGSVQKLQDAIEHEQELRTMGEHMASERMQGIVQKESSDVVTINANVSALREDMSGVRADVHTLMVGSLPQTDPREPQRPRHN